MDLPPDPPWWLDALEVVAVVACLLGIAWERVTKRGQGRADR